MFKNYFKIAWRNIIKNGFHSVFNIIGLSLGIAFSLIIGIYVWSELQVNQNLRNANRQYIIQSKWKDPNEGFAISTLGPLAKRLKEDYPNLVSKYYRFDGITAIVSKNDKALREDLQIGDSTLLTMFGFKLLFGNPTSALNAPFKIVITAEKAVKYFGTTDVVGKTISVENFSAAKHDFVVTGVLDKMPKNSIASLVDEYPDGFFVSDGNLVFFGRNMDWSNPHIAGYIELQSGVSAKDLDQPIQRLIRQNASATVVADLKPYLVPLREYSLDADNGIIRKMLYSLSGVALFILLMAIINFVNMSVSSSSARMREIGIRKVMGGLRSQLIFQFLIESTIIVLIATLIACFIYDSSRFYFGSLLSASLGAITELPAYFAVIPPVLTLIVGFAAGIYPAFVLSSLKSVDSLKGKLSFAGKNYWMGKLLIAIQFGIATTAFIGAIVISKQVGLFLGNELGYNKDYVISAQLPRNWTPQGVDKMEYIRNEFAATPGVTGVALSFEVPDGNNSGQVPLFNFGSDSLRAIAAIALTTDENFQSVYQIPLMAGSFFKGHALDSAKIILNEAAAHALGWKDIQTAAGKQVGAAGTSTVFTVEGVVNDFHFSSMQQKIAPLVFFNVQFNPIYRYLSFKVRPGSVPTIAETLQKKWSALMPGAPFEYRFMDERLAKIYKTEIQLKQASYTATTLALIITLLGVLGLISLSTKKRIREIGIRKVLGSTVTGIMVLFLKGFFLLIFLATAVACPLAYLLMDKWLQEYVYRIRLTAEPFIISFFCIVSITALIICLQTIRAARANPVKSLRSE